MRSGLPHPTTSQDPNPPQIAARDNTRKRSFLCCGGRTGPVYSPSCPCCRPQRSVRSDRCGGPGFGPEVEIALVASDRAAADAISRAANEADPEGEATVGEQRGLAGGAAEWVAFLTVARPFILPILEAILYEVRASGALREDPGRLGVEDQETSQAGRRATARAAPCPAPASRLDRGGSTSSLAPAWEQTSSGYSTIEQCRSPDELRAPTPRNGLSTATVSRSCGSTVKPSRSCLPLTALKPPISRRASAARYLELTAYFRNLYMQDWQGELRTELAAAILHACLRTGAT